MIETKGLIACIEAADAMIKATNVKLLQRRAIGGGYMTVMVRGDVGAVRTTLEAGSQAARRLGQVVSVRMLPSHIWISSESCPTYWSNALSTPHVTPSSLRSKKRRGQKILTAYDYPMASFIEQAGADIVLRERCGWDRRQRPGRSGIRLGRRDDLPHTLGAQRHETMHGRHHDALRIVQHHRRRVANRLQS